MGRYQAVAAKQIDQRQGLYDGRRHQRQHDDMAVKGFAFYGGARHGVGIEKNDYGDDNGRGERNIETVPQGVEGVSSGEILGEIGQGEIGQAEFSSFKKAQL